MCAFAGFENFLHVGLHIIWMDVKVFAGTTGNPPESRKSGCSTAERFRRPCTCRVPRIGGSYSGVLAEDIHYRSEALIDFATYVLLSGARASRGGQCDPCYGSKLIERRASGRRKEDEKT